MRSYTSSTGVSPLRRPVGEDIAGHPRGGMIIAIAGHGTESCGAAPRFLLHLEARVSTFKESR